MRYNETSHRIKSMLFVIKWRMRSCIGIVVENYIE